MIRTLLIGFVRLYQLTLSKVLLAIFGPVCRFEPSCSQYALECLKIHGAAYGGLLSVKRLCKCHPLNPGGYDPPPPLRKPSLPTPNDENSPASGPPPTG